MNRLFIIALVILFTSNIGFAQTFSSNEQDNKYLSFGLNSDSFTGFELGYEQKPGILREKDLSIYLRFSFPLLLTVRDRSFDTWEVKLGMNSKLFIVNEFGVIGDINFFLIHHNEILGEFIPLGVNLRITPSYSFDGGYIGLQLNWNQIIATHISHSQYVKESFENLNSIDNEILNIHPKDGWYTFTGSHLGFGIEGGWDVSQRFFLYGDIGIIKFSSLYSGMFDAMMMGQVPFYGNLRVLYKL